MKRLVVGLGLGLWLASSSVAFAYEDAEGTSHPFRLSAYALNPVGLALEWVFVRPVHWLVSGSETRRYLFGYDAKYGNDYKWAPEIEPEF